MCNTRAWLSGQVNDRDTIGDLFDPASNTTILPSLLTYRGLAHVVPCLQVSLRSFPCHRTLKLIPPLDLYLANIVLQYGSASYQPSKTSSTARISATSFPPTKLSPLTSLPGSLTASLTLAHRSPVPLSYSCSLLLGARQYSQEHSDT